MSSPWLGDKTDVEVGCSAEGRSSTRRARRAVAFALCSSPFYHHSDVFQCVLDDVESGKVASATVLAGSLGANYAGYFVRLALFIDAPHDVSMLRKDVPKRVCAIVKFESEALTVLGPRTSIAAHSSTMACRSTRRLRTRISSSQLGPGRKSRLFSLQKRACNICQGVHVSTYSPDIAICVASS